MDAPERMPRLVYPFAIVGAAAGWLAATLLDNPIADATPNHAAGRAALCSAAIAAGLGLLLQRRCVPRVAFASLTGMWTQVVIFVGLGGTLSGAITGWLAFENERGTTSGALAGLGAALGFLPVCVLVIAAARRAARARLGSLVAAADRRELWALMASALAVTTATAFPDWMAQETPIVALSLAVAALTAIVALGAFDLRAALVVRRASGRADRMEIRERAAEEAEGSLPALDLGLGDEVRASLARSAAAYRGRDRASSLLLGSLDEARAAVRRALVKKALAAAVAALALAGHALAARPRGEMLFHEILCDHGSPVDCGIAAEMRRAGEPEDLVRAVVLGAHAAERIEQRPERTDRGARIHYRERACFTGDVESCRRAATLLGADEAHRFRLRAALMRACEAGDMRSCEDAARARAAGPASL